MRNTLFKGIAAVAVGALLTGGFGVAASGTAFAKGDLTPALDATDYAINVHTLETIDTVAPEANGREVTALPVDPVTKRPARAVPGVHWKLEQVTQVNGQDVTKVGLKNSPNGNASSGWLALEGVTVDSDGLTRVPVAGKEDVVTDAKGLAEFKGLDAGVYIVTEIAAPAGAPVAPHEARNPFMVILPTHFESGWEHTVDAYPKVPLSGVEKELVEPDQLQADAGAAVTWKVTGHLASPADRPGSPDPSKTGYKKLEYVDVLNPALKFVGVDGVTLLGQPLAEGDYKVTEADNTVTVSLTEAGLAKVSKRGDISFIVHTVLRDGVVPGGEIGNTAVQHADNGDGEVVSDSDSFNPLNGPTTAVLSDGLANGTFEKGLNPDGSKRQPKNKVAKFGNLVVNKVELGNESVLLSGAEFSVFKSEQDAKDNVNPVSVAGKSVSQTGDGGRLVVNSLAVLKESGADYWVREVKAPDGYLLPEGDDIVQKVHVEKGKDVSVVFKDKKIVALPFTGDGPGVVVMVVGVVLLLGGVLLVVARRRRRDDGRV